MWDRSNRKLRSRVVRTFHSWVACPQRGRRQDTSPGDVCVCVCVCCVCVLCVCVLCVCVCVSRRILYV